MKIFDKLQRRFGRFAVPHVTEGLVLLQVLTYFLAESRPSFIESIRLVPERVWAGDLWRPFTFVCETPPMNLLFAIFFWYMFYLMGRTLEETWGAFRYNVYLLVGWAATVLASFLQPQAAASIGFLQGSVFLAFAYLYPDFQFLLFFILPVKVKWLALLQWLIYLYVLMVGTTIAQLMVLASVCNFALFFWHDIWLRIRAGRRRMTQQAGRVREANTPRHACAVCGVTNLSDPKMSFRYCSRCFGTPCYCAEHIQNHEHVAGPPG
jgi:hypothetical protein